MNMMKKVILVSLICVFFYIVGCDDSGVTPVPTATGRVSLTQTNLKPLDQNTDGIYQLWLKFDSGAPTWVSLGRFNINGTGGIVSESGGTVNFDLGVDTGRFLKLSIAVISIEAPGMNNPFPNSTHILASVLTASNFLIDSVVAKLTMSDPNALGAAGRVVTESYGVGLYYLQTPSNSNASCNKGLWLCDTSGVPSMTDTLNLSEGMGWYYKLWVINNLTNTFYPAGNFLSVNAPDSDGAGPCSGPGSGLNAPGQDFIQADSVCPNIGSLYDGNHGVFITLEPMTRTSYANPFFLRIYDQNLIANALGCFRADNLFKQYFRMPYARIRISRSR